MQGLFVQIPVLSSRTAIDDASQLDDQGQQTQAAEMLQGLLKFVQQHLAARTSCMMLACKESCQ